MATLYDLTADGARTTVNGAIFTNDQSIIDQPAGTGVIGPFVRIQANGNEDGFNFDSANIPGNPLDVKPGPWTKLLAVADLQPIEIEGTLYYQFRLDINETSSKSLLSLDKLILYGSTESDLHDYNPVTGTFQGGSAVEIYNLDAGEDRSIGLDYALHSGSGESDLAVFIPVSAFAGSTYVYLYSEFGTLTTGDGRDWSSDDGYEEWYSFSKPATPQFGSISATKWLDSNGDGSIEGDSVLTGWTFHFTGTDGDGTAIDISITDGGPGDADNTLNGTVVLAGLKAGAVVHVEEVLQSGYYQTLGANGYDETISAGENASYDFANAQFGQVIATKYLDDEGDGDITGDAVLTNPPWSFTLSYTQDGVDVVHTVQDGGPGDADGVVNGTVVFDDLLKVGTEYHIEEVQQPGWTPTLGANGYDGSIGTSGEVDYFNFANTPDSEPPPPPPKDFVKVIDVDVDISIDLTMDTEPSLYSDVYVNHGYSVEVDLSGNDATFNIDAEALGDDSSVELNLAVLTTADLSSIIATGYVVVA